LPEWPPPAPSSGLGCYATSHDVGVRCHIAEKLADALKGVRNGWHVRVRGKVITPTEKVIGAREMVDCGIVYNDAIKGP
jgi:hypothetical protein